MDKCYAIGDLKLKLSNNRIIGVGRYQLDKFYCLSDDYDYSIECKYISREQFEEETKTIFCSVPKEQNKEVRFDPNSYFSFKDKIYIKKDFKNKKVKMIYALTRINENSKMFNIEDKILANLEFLSAQLSVALGRIMLHGAGLIRHGNAYIFLARDEGGKTTLIKQNSNLKILSDDQIFYSIKNHKIFAHATPFGLHSDGPAEVPIVAFFYINKSNKFSLKKSDSKGLINSFWMDNSMMLNSLPINLKKRAFNIISKIALSIPVFEIHADHGQIDWDKIDEALKNT